ncbi:hypothetical protein BD309DRAFT_959730 [Dichomitus squalens]|nr:hypothetical protein BD309DRAFT_959730 [Dichomitus squalens]
MGSSSTLIYSPTHSKTALTVDVENKVDILIHSATALIAVCAGSAAVGTLTRKYALYAPSLEVDVDISLTDLFISVDADSATVGRRRDSVRVS